MGDLKNYNKDLYVLFSIFIRSGPKDILYNQMDHTWKLEIYNYDFYLLGITYKMLKGNNDNQILKYIAMKLTYMQ